MAAGEVRVFAFEAMGSPCAIHIDADAEVAELVAGEAMGEIHRIEAKYSRYLPSSLLSEVNRQASLGAAIELDEETAALIDYACKCHQLSGGLFDITSGVLRKAWDFRTRATPDLDRLPQLMDVVGFEKLKWSRPTLGFAVAGMEIDFGGIAKEYAVDRAIEICRSRGISACLVDLGGDIRVGGRHRDDSPWPIAIRSSVRSDTVFATIQLTGGALASSGDYERFIDFEGRRYSHILNPKTGWPVSGLASVSIAAEQCLAAGTCSTIAMLKGDAGARWLADRNLAHAWIDQHGRQYAMPPFELVDQAP